jgi:multidrug resistance efflux pump
MSATTATRGVDADDPLNGVRLPGEGLVDRAVGIVLGICIAVIAIVALAGNLLRMNVGIQARGLLEARTVWPVRATEGGRVVAVHVRTGDTVSAGQLLIELDDAALQSRRRELTARLREARLDRRRAQSVRPIEIQTAREQENLAQLAVGRARTAFALALVDHGRPPDVDAALKAANAGTHVALDLARAELQGELTRLEIARLTLQRLEMDTIPLTSADVGEAELLAQLNDLTRLVQQLAIRAPEAGVVQSDQAAQLVGRLVAPGERLLDLGTTSGWTAQLLVSERDIHGVRVGQSVQMEVNATEGERGPPLTGRVTTVALAPWDGDGRDGLEVLALGTSPMYRVVAAVEAPTSPSLKHDVRQGFTVAATISVSRQPVIRVLIERIFGRGPSAR